MPASCLGRGTLLYLLNRLGDFVASDTYRDTDSTGPLPDCRPPSLSIIMSFFMFIGLLQT
jgi:hypothetical protein